MKSAGEGVRWAWRRELIRVFLWLVAGLLLGLIAQRMMLGLVLALGTYLVLQLLYTFQLHRWLASNHIQSAEGVGVWQDIYSELYRLKQRNRRRKHRLRRIVHEYKASTAALPDATVVLDARDRIDWFNHAAAALLGLRSPQDLNQSIGNLLRHPRFLAYATGAARDQDGIEIPSPVNPETPLAVRVIAYGNDQRLLVARDISEQKRLDSLRRDFVANASHELRTPLTVVRGYLEMMEQDAGGPGPLEAWQVPIRQMHAQAQRMDRIIDSLLTLARVEAHGAQQTQQRVDVPAMLDTLIHDIARATGTDHTIETDIEAGLALYARPGELESLFSNLLSNAVRYTPVGGCITVRWWQCDTKDAKFAVTDTGPGIESKHIPRLTERFYRANNQGASSNQGTGLGLAIVKHCLDHHDGHLTIDSTPGRGTTFTASFPTSRVLPEYAA